jgi:disulfide bond formation protein DsbB
VIAAVSTARGVRDTTLAGLVVLTRFLHANRYPLRWKTHWETNVTLDATANQSHAHNATNPALTAALAITAIAAATLAGAWYFQLVLDIRPCPLCLEQRYAYYLAIPLGALVALAAAKDAPRGVLLAGLVILALAAFGNAGLGTYHAGVEWKFWQGPTDCTGPVGNLGSAGDLLARLDTEKVIRCDEVQWRFLGLSLAGYNVLISLLMAAIAGWGLALTRRQRA